MFAEPDAGNHWQALPLLPLCLGLWFYIRVHEFKEVQMIIVTGATGFVGRRLIARLAATYGAENIVCLVYDQIDDLEITGRAILDELGIRYIPIDLVSGRGLDLAPKSPDKVFHLASNTDTGASDHRVNDVGTKNLVEALHPLGSNCQFVFTSTIAVSDHREHPDAPVNEDTPLLTPYSDYGRRKLLAEKYLLEQSAAHGFKVTIVRLCAVFGKQTRNLGIFDRVAQLATDDSIIARLNYPGLIGFVNVDDISYILTTLAEPEATEGSLRNELFIPVSEVLTMAELIQSYYEVYGKNYRPIALPTWFWSLCDTTARVMMKFEPVMPHFVHNRFWQIALVVGKYFDNQSSKIQRRIPGLNLKRLRDSLPEMVGLR